MEIVIVVMLLCFGSMGQISHTQKVGHSHSHEILSLLSRVCFEVEANLKGILLANNYSVKGAVIEAKTLTMKDYCKIEHSHFLSRYTVKFPNWSEGAKEFRPFHNWGLSVQKPLNWYQDYNIVKHERNIGFQKANLEKLCNSFAALVAILTSQFWQEDTMASFALSLGQSPGLEGHNSSLVNGFFFNFNPDFTETERYNLNPETVIEFQKFDYS